jgi:hypothetical protein
VGFEPRREFGEVEQPLRAVEQLLESCDLDTTPC